MQTATILKVDGLVYAGAIVHHEQLHTAWKLGPTLLAINCCRVGMVNINGQWQRFWLY